MLSLSYTNSTLTHTRVLASTGGRPGNVLSSALINPGSTCVCPLSLFLFACLSVCPQVDVSPVTALNLLLELPPNTVNNTQRLSLLRRAFTAARGMTAVTTEFVEVIRDL